MPKPTPSPAVRDRGGAGEAWQAAAAALDRLCPPGPLGLAVSGGSDSTALLIAAHDWAGPERRLEVATVDHRLRVGSAAEAEDVAALCSALGRRHTTLAWAEGPRAAGGPGNLQARAREARQALLGAWAAERGLSAVLLGHTLDDQAETVLLRLARGSGADGLSGMAAASRHAGTLWLRPLLELRRMDLRAALADRGIGWTDDPSNEDPRFDRVKARRALSSLAPLGIESEGLAATARRLAMQARVLEAAMAALAVRGRRWGVAGEAVLDMAALAAAEEDTRLRLIADTLMRLSGASYRPRFAALEDFAASLFAGTPGRTLSGCAASSDGRTAILWREVSACAGPVPLSPNVLWDGRWRIETTGPWPRTQVSALGADGLAALSRLAEAGVWEAPPAWSAVPRAARASVPALRAPGGSLLAVPAVGYLDPALAACACVIATKDMASPPDP